MTATATKLSRDSAFTLGVLPAVRALARNRTRSVARAHTGAIDRANRVPARLQILVWHSPEQRRSLRQIPPAAPIEIPGRKLDERLLHALLPLHRLEHVTTSGRAGGRRLRNPRHAVGAAGNG